MARWAKCAVIGAPDEERGQIVKAFVVLPAPNAAAGAFAEYIEPSNPPKRGWEAYLPSDLHVYGTIKLCDWEVVGINAQSWDAGLADAAFDAVRLSLLISLYVHMLFPRRFPGRVLRNMSNGSLVFTALGLVNGREAAALTLVRTQLEALRRKYFDPDLTYPTRLFCRAHPRRVSGPGAIGAQE